MGKIKFFIIGCALTCALASHSSKALTSKEADAAFTGLIVCDGSQKAEKTCKEKCTGDHPLLLIEGTCKDQKVWDYCRSICRKDWIEDCARTSTKHTLTGLAQCQ